MSTTLNNVIILSFRTKIVNTSLCFRVRESAKVESHNISFWTTGRLFVTTTQRSGKNTEMRLLQKSNGQLQPTQICRGTLRGWTCPVLSDSRTNNHPSGVEAVEIHTVTPNHKKVYCRPGKMLASVLMQLCRRLKLSSLHKFCNLRTDFVHFLRLVSPPAEFVCPNPEVKTFQMQGEVMF